MRTVNAKKGSVLPVGRLGENIATVVVFDVSCWEQQFGSGTFELLNQRSGDAAAYPCVIEQDGDTVRWTVKSADVAVTGYGRCELVYRVGELIAKSEIYTTVVGAALTGGGEVPEPWEDWVESVLAAGTAAQEAKAQWENMTAEAETLPAGEEATASYADGVLHLGIPGGATHPYLSLSRLAPYLFDVSFADVPEDNGAAEALGACTSYVKDGKLYRNLDWEYSNLASFRVRCSGFEGVAFLPGLTDTELSDELIGQLPYHLTDGVNSHGIMVAEHVLFNDWDWHGTGNIPLTKMPYLILTRVRSMATIEEDLADILPQLCTTPMQDASEYLLQFIVTDGETTCAILPPTDGGDYEIVDITENAKMTNFRWVPDGTVDRADLQLRPTGVERWNMIPAALKSLRFTLAYEAPDRLSEFIGIRGTTKDSTDEELEAVYELAAAEYARRERDGKTWQTMHSVVYSANGLESLCVQENWSKDYASGMALPERPAFDSRKKYALCLIPNAAGTDWELAWSEFTPQDPAASSIVGTGKVGYMIIE